MINSSFALTWIKLILVSFVIYGCGQSPQLSINTIDLIQNPNPTVPLAAILSISASEPTTLSINIDDAPTVLSSGTFTITSSFTNTLTYDSDVQILSQDSDNSVTMANPYLFNNVSYSSYSYIGVTIGTYRFTGVTTSHPLGFVIDDDSLLEVKSGSLYGTKTVEETSVNYYTGDIEIEVKGNFGIISYACYWHGYMGGQNRLKYVEPVASQEYELYKFTVSRRSMLTEIRFTWLSGSNSGAMYYIIQPGSSLQTDADGHVTERNLIYFLV